MNLQMIKAYPNRKTQALQNESTPREILYPGGALHLDRTIIMGVLNITPDSFSDGGKFYAPDRAIEQAFRMLDDGADIIDVGGESTRPGAETLPLEEELKRVIPVIQEIIKEHPEAVISIDTYKSAVASEALKAGARMVNDISGLGLDPRMKEVVRDARVPVVIMHIKGTPRDMQEQPYYDDVINEIARYFRERIAGALRAGLTEQQIILDPGIGFGKRVVDNYEIIGRLEEFIRLGYPVLVGPSRKSFIDKVLNLPPGERLFGTAAAVTAAVLKGAQVVRVHDVREMKQVIKIAEAIREWKKPLFRL